MMSNYDLSSELQIKLHQRGVKLIRPDTSGDSKSIGEMMKKHYNVYFLDAIHHIRAINEVSWQSCGFQSERDAVGSSMARVVSYRSQLHELFNHENQVMKANRAHVFAQLAELNVGRKLNCVSTLLPWYGEGDQIIGTFGCAVVLNDKDLNQITSQLSEINKLFLSSDITSSVNPEISIFSQRELEVIKLIMRGKTMREIAFLLGLSCRTVESYYTNIKLKADVTTRSDLIEKYYDSF